MFKVRYIAGSGVELAKPLSTGHTSFSAGIDYEIATVADFCRLMNSGSFEVTEFDETLLDKAAFLKGNILAKVGTAIDTPSRDPLKVKLVVPDMNTKEDTKENIS